MPPLQIAGRTTYFGGFSHLGITEIRHGRLVLNDDVLMLDLVQNAKFTRELPPIELCRTRAIASIEITSEQVAKSKIGAAALFGVLGAVTAKSATDRATVLVYLKNGEVGCFAVTKQSTASLLGAVTPWMREHGIALGSPEPETVRSTIAPGLIADELAKLAQLRDSGVLSDEEFATLKAQLIRDQTGSTAG